MLNACVSFNHLNVRHNIKLSLILYVYPRNLYICCNAIGVYSFNDIIKNSAYIKGSTFWVFYVRGRGGTFHCHWFVCVFILCLFVCPPTEKLMVDFEENYRIGQMLQGTMCAVVSGFEQTVSRLVSLEGLCPLSAYFGSAFSVYHFPMLKWSMRPNAIDILVCINLLKCSEGGDMLCIDSPIQTSWRTTQIPHHSMYILLFISINIISYQF